MSRPLGKRPAGVYVVALFFSAIWLFSVGSLVYVLFFKFTPEMRRQLSFTPALASLGIGNLNLSLTVVASWLLCAMSWPALIPAYLRHPNGALLHPLLMGGGNLLVHIAATVYAFRLDRKGLLR